MLFMLCLGGCLTTRAACCLWYVGYARRFCGSLESESQSVSDWTTSQGKADGLLLWVVQCPQSTWFAGLLPGPAASKVPHCSGNIRKQLPAIDRYTRTTTRDVVRCWKARTHQSSARPKRPWHRSMNVLFCCGRAWRDVLPIQPPPLPK